MVWTRFTYIVRTCYCGVFRLIPWWWGGGKQMLSTLEYHFGEQKLNT